MATTLLDMIEVCIYTSFSSSKLDSVLDIEPKIFSEFLEQEKHRKLLMSVQRHPQSKLPVIIGYKAGQTLQRRVSEARVQKTLTIKKKLFLQNIIQDKQ